MALKIISQCINCDVCEPQCPNQAIYPSEHIYVIDPDLCTECVGHHDQPQCQIVCPVDCIIQDTDYVEPYDSLYKKFERLTTPHTKQNK